MPLRNSLAIASIGLFLPMLSGCAGSLLSYSLDTPAVALSPVASTNIRDQRARFRDVFCDTLRRDGLDEPGACSRLLHQLSDEPSIARSGVTPGWLKPTVDVLLVPGIFGECVQDTVTLFGDATPHLESLGYRTAIIPVRGRASSGHNATIIRDHVLAHVARHPGRRVVLVGYSKGVPDALLAINQYSELWAHVAGLVSVAGVVNGTPIADHAHKAYDFLLSEAPIHACPPVDQGEVQSLTRSERLAWLAAHALPKEMLYFSLVAMPEPDRVSAVLRPFHAMLSRVDPRNDSQVIDYDAIIPGSTLLGYVNADHWAIALPFDSQAPLLAATLVTRNAFPRKQLLEAVLRLVEETLAETSPR
jgi:hypothetical protein